MTSPANSPSALPSPGGRRRSTWQRLSLIVQLLLSLAVAGGALVYLIRAGTKPPSPEDEKRPSPPEEFANVAGPRLIRVRPGTAIENKLRVATVESALITAPAIPVTGAALASLKPGKEIAKDTWQFATPELLSAFTDWQKAVVDVEFQITLLEAIRELAAFRVEAQKEVVARLEKLQAAGDKTEKEVVAERVNLKQFEIQGRREVHEGENALRVSQKAEAALSRQLQQAGLEPTLLRSAAAEGEIVVAEVPEGATARVKLGMICEVRFFAMRDRLFTGKVSSMSPVITKEKRILNVQFIVKDPDGLIRPGMFAEIGLGTDPRQALLVPTDGVLHIDDKDYILIVTKLVDDKVETLKIVDVQTGAPWPLFRLTEKSIASLGAAEVPESIIAKLTPLKKRGFATSELLTAALAKALDAGELEHYRELILSQAEREPNIEVRSAAIKAGETVLGNGAILLKPVIVRALQAPAAERGDKGR
jgi:hypothetical protein